MNLQENIQRIQEVMGVNESSFLRRRVDISLLDSEFLDNLNYVSDIFFKKLDIEHHANFNDFKRRIIDNIIDNYHGELSNWGNNEFPYDEIYLYLSDRYLPKIEERFNKIINY